MNPNPHPSSATPFVRSGWNLQSRAEKLAIGGLNIAFLFAAIAMCALLAVAIGYFAASFYQIVLRLSTHKSEHEPIYLAVKGVEFLFLAPLGFIVVDSLLRYFSVIIASASENRGLREERETELRRKTDDEKKAARLLFDAEFEKIRHRHRKQELHARGRLLVAKAFTISLLAATVATALVGAVISSEKGIGITIDGACAGAVVLIALIVLLVIVQREVGECERHSEADKNEPVGH